MVTETETGGAMATETETEELAEGSNGGDDNGGEGEGGNEDLCMPMHAHSGLGGSEDRCLLMHDHSGLPPSSQKHIRTTTVRKTQSKPGVTKGSNADEGVGWGVRR